MAKLLLLSNILMAMWLPIRLARDPLQRRGLRRLAQAMLLYNIFYVFAALVIYPHIR